ncbi:hypothetical protein L505_2587, partial [Bordetella bronchiseptica F4563]
MSNIVEIKVPDIGDFKEVEAQPSPPRRLRPWPRLRLRRSG